MNKFKAGDRVVYLDIFSHGDRTKYYREWELGDMRGMVGTVVWVDNGRKEVGVVFDAERCYTQVVHPDNLQLIE